MAAGVDPAAKPLAPLARLAELTVRTLATVTGLIKISSLPQAPQSGLLLEAPQTSLLPKAPQLLSPLLPGEVCPLQDPLAFSLPQPRHLDQVTPEDTVSVDVLLPGGSQHGH